MCVLQDNIREEREFLPLAGQPAMLLLYKTPAQ